MKRSQQGGKPGQEGKGGKKDDPQKPQGGDPKEGEGSQKQDAAGDAHADPREAKDVEREGSGEEKESLGQTEIERIDRLLEDQEKEQRRIQQIRARMRKKDGEGDW